MMNVATQVLKKDFRHNRFLITLWLLLVTLYCATLCLNSSYTAVNWFIILQWLLLIVLIPRIVQDDPLVGTRAFWLTRPIGRAALYRSKTLSAVLAPALVPLLGYIIVLAVNGATRHDMILAIPEVLMDQFFYILCITLLAVVTPDFGRLAIAAVSLAVGLTLLLAIFVQFAPHRPEAANSTSLSASRTTAFYSLGIFATAVLVVYQYLTRNVMVTAAGAIVCAILMPIVLGYWSWDFLKPKMVTEGDPNLDLSAIKVSLSPLTIRRPATHKWRVDTEFAIVGLPRGYSVKVDVTNPSLKLQGGNSVALKSVQVTGMDGSPNSSDYEGAFEAALGGAAVLNSSNSTGDFVNPLISLQSAVLNESPGQPAGLSAHVEIVAYRYTVTSEMDVVNGSRYDHGSDHLVITDVQRRKSSVTIVLRQKKLNLLLAPDDNPSAPPQFLLVNKKRREAYVLQSNSVIASDWLVNRPVRLTVAAESDLAPAITAQWLADASLERIEWTPVAAFSRDLTEDKFPLQAASPFHHSASVKPNMEALRRITLPVNATKEQARDYVEAVMLASRNQTVYEIEDSQVGMLEKVGRPNLGVLIEFANRVGSPGQLTYLNAAIEGLASPEDAALILKGLNADPELVDLVIRYGWEGAARDILVSELENSVVLPVDWIKAVVSMRDPATYPALKAYLINGDNPEETFDLVKELPGLDLGDAIDEIWTAKRYASPYSVLKVCALAAQYGHVDAIETAADILKKEDDPYDQNRARQVILKLTAATGDDKALVAWVESNRGKLVFDKASGKFWVGRR